MIPAFSPDARVAAVLALPAVVADGLALPDGLPASGLHLTVAYFGRVQELPVAGVARILEALSRATRTTPPVKGKISGIGRFEASETSDGQDVFYLSFDATNLAPLREAVVAYAHEAGVPAKTDAHGFTPHISLAYIPPDAPTPEPPSWPTDVIVFPALTLMVEDWMFPVPFMGQAEALAAFLRQVPPSAVEDVRGVYTLGADLLGRFTKSRMKSFGRRVAQEIVPEGDGWRIRGEAATFPTKREAIQHLRGTEGPEEPSMEKTVWTAQYVTDLPDAAFAVIEPGGEKDADGKTTPRSLRHLPYKNAEGQVDLPHLRNALARLPQTNIPADLKASAQRMLDAAASAAGVGKAVLETADVPALAPEQTGAVRARDLEPPAPPLPPETREKDEITKTQPPEEALLAAYLTHLEANVPNGFDADKGGDAVAELVGPITEGYDLYRVTDGWGEWYFSVAGGTAAWVAQKMADVQAYAVSKRLAGVFDKSTVKDLGWGDAAWDAALLKAMQDAVLTRSVRVVKAVVPQRYTLGVAYPANELDAHRQFMSPEQLEIAAWKAMRGGLRIGLLHAKGTDGAGVAVESYIWRGPKWDVDGQVVEPGDWLVGTVWEPDAWKRIEDGEIVGYSMQGWSTERKNRPVGPRGQTPA